jgi:hypothetical protein
MRPFGHRWSDVVAKCSQQAVEMLVKRALPVLAFVVGALVAGGAVGMGPLTPVFYRPISIRGSGGVLAVDIRPIPEGPQPQSRPPIDQIEPYIPDPLPTPLFQWFCGAGGDLVVTLGNGMQVTYGPCYRPPSIDHLWAEIVYLDTNGQCAPRCGPGGKPGP